MAKKASLFQKVVVTTISTVASVANAVAPTPPAEKPLATKIEQAQTVKNVQTKESIKKSKSDDTNTNSSGKKKK